MVTAESGQKNYLTQISNGTSNLCSDTAGDSGGLFGPYDLLCAGYAACLNITVRMVLDKMDLKYDSVVTRIDVDEAEPDSTVFLYQVEIVGDIGGAAKEAVISKALNCPVRRALSKRIAFKPM